MNILKALSKQLFGAKYESAGRSLIVCLILFLVIDGTEKKIMIAPFILFFTATAFSAGIMWQVLRSSHRMESMKGLFMLPFANRGMTFSMVFTFAGYTVVTKTLPVFAVFFAVHKWSIAQMALALLCALNGCFTVAVWYIMIKKKKRMPIMFLWGSFLFLSIFLVPNPVIFSLIVFANLLISMMCLLRTDAYAFYQPAFARPLIKRSKGCGGALLYLLRYLLTNKNYLLNTACLCAVACVLPHILRGFEGWNVMPMGFAVLCLNTPICILLSCDFDLEQAVRVLPGQARLFFTRYCIFIFGVNMAVSGVYLASWQIRLGGVEGTDILTAVLTALQSALLSVLLEWRHPVRGWKVESDLWHHPRKYIVPGIMLLVTGLVGIWPAGVWVFLSIVIVEVSGLLVITGQNSILQRWFHCGKM